jgi:copper transport protein
VVLVCVLSALGTATASAHAKLQNTSPSQSATYKSGDGPRVAIVTFDEAVNAPAEFLKVYGGTGQALQGVVARPQKAARVEAALPPLRDGTYVAVWRIVSDDGHPEQGAFTFTVGKGGTTAADINALLASGQASWELGDGFGLDRLFAYLGAFLFVGGLVYLRLAWPTALQRRRVRRFLFVSAGVAIAATLLSIPLEAAYSTAQVSNLFDGTALGNVLETRFGTGALWRALFLLLLVPAVVVFVGRAWSAARVMAESVVIALGLAVWATFAYAGHGDSGRLVPLGFTTDVAHLAAASLWLGGITALAVASLATGPSDQGSRAGTRFSTVALPAIAVIVLSGIVQGWRQVGSWGALFHTTYGRLLIVKVGLVAGIVIVASASRDVVRDRVVSAVRGMGRPRAAMAADAEFARELRNGIWTEVLLAVVVLAVTAALVFTTPGGEAEQLASQPAPHTVFVTTSTSRFSYRVAMQPALAGLNTIVIAPESRQKEQLLPATLTATLAGRGRKVATVPFAALPDGRFVASIDLTGAPVHLAFTASDGTTTDHAVVTLGIR